MRKKNQNMIIPLIILAIFLAALSIFKLTMATTNISATDHWAWNDLIGWLDFYNTNNINVSDTQLTGYASSSAGDISLDCATTRSGDICGQSNYKVTNNGAGSLSGWGWNDTYGWISFDCNNPSSSGCGASNYEVLVDGSTGDFSNYAWNDIIGWISFFQATSPAYKVNTSWRTSSATGTLTSTIFDTGISGGAQINSVLWYGDQPSNTSVGFQFAVAATSTGPWNYFGPDGTSGSWYTANTGFSKSVDYVLHNNARYFRYRIQLTSNAQRTLSPRVDDVHVNWSR